MKVAITETFCEILTGLATILMLIAWLDWLNIVPFDQTLAAAKAYSGFATLTGVLIAAYLFGVILDAFGLVFDRLFADLVFSDNTTADNIKGFWTNANAHVLAYRDSVWAYYFCYRNLLILVPPALLGTVGSLWCRQLSGWAWFAAIALIVLAFILYFSMQTLLKLYYDITRSFVPNIMKNNQ